jgi:hypothetical protein
LSLWTSRSASAKRAMGGDTNSLFEKEFVFFGFFFPGNAHDRLLDWGMND